MQHQNMYQQLQQQPLQQQQLVHQESDSFKNGQFEQQQQPQQQQQHQQNNYRNNNHNHHHHNHHQQQNHNNQQQQGFNNYNQSNQMQQRQVMPMSQNNSGKYKTTLCRHFRSGNCQLGAQCHFAHGQEEMRQTSDPLPQNVPQQLKIVSNFKTVKCRYFEKGFCKNQHACCFAHGDTDLSMISYGSNNNNSSNNGYQNQQVPAMNSQQNKITDSILLISILQNLEHVFPNDNQILQKLQYAQQIAKQCDQKGAFNIISDIMKDPKRTDEEKALYNTIYTNAQMFYQQQQQMFNQNFLPGYPQMLGFTNTPAVDQSAMFLLQQQQQQQQVQQQQQYQQLPQQQQQLNQQQFKNIATNGN